MNERIEVGFGAGDKRVLDEEGSKNYEHQPPGRSERNQHPENEKEVTDVKGISQVAIGTGRDQFLNANLADSPGRADVAGGPDAQDQTQRDGNKPPGKSRPHRAGKDEDKREAGSANDAPETEEKTTKR